jgi:NAD(P)-dependent dehydrogenase (short-subunit alcohol dehydrogenase family)
VQDAVMLVLGATGAVGSATCRRLVARGATVVAAGRSSDELAGLEAELGVETRLVDVLEPGAVEQAVAAVREAHGRLDGAALLVGSILLKPAHLTRDAEFEEVLRLNLWPAFHLVKAMARAIGPDGGSVVLVSTAAATTGLPNHEAIAAAKAGVEGLARSAAATYAPKGLRVNVVAPGLVEAKMSARLFASEPARAASLAMHPLGRLGQPGDVASAVTWLLDPEQSWVTGQVIGVDGGLAHLKGRGG